MSGDIRVDDFEQRLIENVEMLYGVALKLTRNPDAAEQIMQTTLNDAWLARNDLRSKRRLKADLLRLLRRAFCDYCGMSGLQQALDAFGNPELPGATTPCGRSVSARQSIGLAATS